MAPWLKKQRGIRFNKSLKAQITQDFSYDKKLTYFLQVQIQSDKHGVLQAVPVKGRGPNDPANLYKGYGFLELPEDRDHFKAGECYSLYRYRSLILNPVSSSYPHYY